MKVIKIPITLSPWLPRLMWFAKKNPTPHPTSPNLSKLQRETTCRRWVVKKLNCYLLWCWIIQSSIKIIIQLPRSEGIFRTMYTQTKEQSLSCGTTELLSLFWEKLQSCDHHWKKQRILLCCASFIIIISFLFFFISWSFKKNHMKSVLISNFFVVVCLF